MQYKKILSILAVIATISIMIPVHVYAKTLQEPQMQMKISDDLKQDPFADAKRKIEQQKTDEVKKIETEKKNNELKNSFLVQIDRSYALIKEKQGEAQIQTDIYSDYMPAREKFENIKNIANEVEEMKKNAEKFRSVVKVENDELGELKGLADQIANKTSEMQNIELTVDRVNGYYDISETRKSVLNAALSLVGKIPYSWGEKPDHAGWNDKWDDGTTGLDCSGFVQWVYWTATNEENAREELGSTLNITHNYTEISKDELLPGDLGTITTDGSYYLDQFGNKYYSEEEARQGSITAGGDGCFRTITNHVGIYLGLDENENKMWIHCYGAPKNTVVITTEEEFDKFVHYYRVLEE